MTKLFFITFLLLPSFTFAGTISVNGQTYTCDGSIVMNNDQVLCNGQPLTGGGSAIGPCGGSSARSPALGSGKVDVLATVAPTARVDGTVCGRANIGANAIVHRGAIINGQIRVERGAVIESGANLNGSGTVGSNVVVGANSNLNGTINLSESNIAPNTNLNGNISIQGVRISGGINCSGTGTIIANPPADTTR